MLSLLISLSSIIPLIIATPLGIHPSIQLNLSEVASANPLNSLELFNNQSNLLDGGNLDITCFHQDRINPLGRTNVHDCTLAVNKIAIPLSPSPFDFHRTPDRPFPLPNSFSAGSCLIWVDMESDDAEDTFSPTDVLVAVSRIIGRCVGDSPALGGKTLVGPKKLMNVFVFGRWFSNEGVSSGQ